MGSAKYLNYTRRLDEGFRSKLSKIVYANFGVFKVIKSIPEDTRYRFILDKSVLNEKRDILNF